MCVRVCVFVFVFVMGLCLWVCGNWYRVCSGVCSGDETVKRTSVCEGNEQVVRDKLF